MDLNRGLIKQQAKQLIQNNTLKLFAISIVISLCFSAISGGISIVVNFNNILHGTYPFSIFSEDHGNYGAGDFDFDFDDDFNKFGKDEDDLDDFDDFGEDFNNFGTDDDFDDFFEDYGFDFDSFNENKQITPQANTTRFLAVSGISSFFSMLARVAFILLAPLEISLAGYYVSFIRGNKVDVSNGLSTIFRNTFKNKYGNKVALAFLRGLFIGLLALLFIIPGIVYHYSTYFAYQIMADNPDISPTQALKLSKKMVKGNRTELFVLDLSFIPWYLLCMFVFPLIYVIPYVSTTQALFYENFRIRAFREGRITEDDFLSEAQIYAKYANIYANPNNAAPNGNDFQQNGYQPYGQPNQQYNPQNANPYYNAQPNGQYYQPPQNGYAPNGYYPPNQNVYNPPPQQQPPQQPQAEYYNPAPKAEEPIEQAEPEEPKAVDTRDPWEINHED